jgi:tripartite-type tricarboxylate transporter receptor subunit TctC
VSFSRRGFIRTAGSAALLTTCWKPAFAADYPNAPVHIVLGFPAGGSSDTIGRMLAQLLSQQLGQPFIFDNRPGAGSNIGTEYVGKSAPDGYTLLLSTSANAINTTLYRNLKFDFARDFAPIAGLFRVPNVLEVHPSVPVHSVPELIAYAKANPGKLNFASGGNGSVAHIAGEMFKSMTGVDMRHVPYRGSALALIDLLSGQVQLTFDLLPASLGHINAGKLRALAVTTKERSARLPDLPSISDFLPGYEASTWNGLSAPAGTPADVIDKLNNAVNEALKTPQVKARLADLGAMELIYTPAEYGRLCRDDSQKWGQVIKSANIKIE